MVDVDDLLTRFHAGERRALSRLLTLLARGEHTHKVMSALPAATATKSVALTGSGGVGKSTLIGKLLPAIRQDGKKVAVLACDPQSPVSGGALLGDRFRMTGATPDDGIFIRSLPAVSGHGAVADHLQAQIRLLSAFGFDIILIETVGAGQGDVTVAEMADVVVLLLQPEAGDDLQWEKAGVLEVADIVVVQKADMPKAEQTAAQVRGTLELSDAPAVPVLLVSGKTGQGVAELWQSIASLDKHNERGADPIDDLLDMVRDELTQRYTAARQTNHAALRDLVAEWQQGRVTSERAALTLLNILFDKTLAEN